MVCSIKGFQEIVDAMGGVEIDVEKRMKYRDRSQQLDIDLHPGLQLLNGRQAMGYVRFRHDARGDLARIERQQKFLKSAASKLLRPGSSRHALSTLEAILRNVKTDDVTANDLRGVKREVERVGLDNVRMVSLPARPHMISHISYLEPDMQAVACLVDDVIYGRLPTVEVLNGTRVDQLGQRVAQKLADKGYPINIVANASYSYTSTQVINHSGWQDQAERIGKLIGCGRVGSDRPRQSDADITVVVGSDYLSAAGERPRSRAY
jgi:anionic cell wall polymer biosynthesis LytR-Cps2A-Psr (LCP) family protein